MARGINIPSPILPGNTPGALSPVIPVESAIKTPVRLITKKKGFNFQSKPDALPSRAEEKQEVSASKFPILRGFD